MGSKPMQERPGWAQGMAERSSDPFQASASLQSAETWNQATDAVLETLDLDHAPDLLIVFIDSRFSSHYADIISRLSVETGARHLIGCAGQAVVGPSIESERQPAISVMALRLPGAVLTPIPVEPGPRLERDIEMPNTIDVNGWLMFSDPFSIDPAEIIALLERQWPGLPVVGGLASAHNHLRGMALFLDGKVYPVGAVLLGIGGAVSLHSVVAQGAEPIGLPWTITECERNVIREIGSRPAMEVLVETIEGLSEANRERARQNLLVGLALDEYRDEFGRGDFLIRNLTGADRKNGAISINALPRVGQTFQFQLRDASAADEDLRERLASFRSSLVEDQEVLGGVLCTCNGRGIRLFNVQNHDAQTVADVLGPLPVAGLFCNGEIGPVGGKTFLHGFTVSLALFTTRRSERTGEGEPPEREAEV